MGRKVTRAIILIVSVFCFNGYQTFSQSVQETENDSTDNRFILINEIYIIGNDKTKESIITRELDFAEGEQIPAAALDEILEQSRKNIYNTNLFSTVELKKLELDSSTIDIMIKLEERWYIYPSVVFRLIDRNFNDWWINRDHDLSRTKYGVKLDVYNMRGRKEKLKVIGVIGYEKNLLLSYSIPYIEKTQKHGLAIGASYISNNNVAYITRNHVDDYYESEREIRSAWSGSVLYSYRPSFFDYHYVTLSTFGSQVADSIALLNPNYLGESETRQTAVKLSYSYLRDKRDNRNYPLSGYFLYGEIEKAGMGIFNDIDIWRFTANYYKYYDLGSGFYANTGVGTQLSTVNNVPYFNYIKFGLGNYYVRGFEDVVVEGPFNFLSKNSLRKRLFNTQLDMGKWMPIKQFRKIPFAFYAKLFADVGYVRNYPGYEANDRLTDRPIYGLGVGLDIVTLYDLTFRVEYSYNSEEELNLFINFQSELSF